MKNNKIIILDISVLCISILAYLFPLYETTIQTIMDSKNIAIDSHMVMLIFLFFVSFLVLLATSIVGFIFTRKNIKNKKVVIAIMVSLFIITILSLTFIIYEEFNSINISNLTMVQFPNLIKSINYHKNIYITILVLGIISFISAQYFIIRCLAKYLKEIKSSKVTN